MPEPAWLDKEPRCPGTDGQKMSKSYGNTIEIFAEGKPLKKTVMGIETDSTPVEAPKDPDKCNVFALYSLFATEDEKIGAGGPVPRRAAWATARRRMLLEKIDDLFGPAREKRKQLAADPAIVEGVLQQGAAKARAEAEATMKLVRAAAGF